MERRRLAVRTAPHFAGPRRFRAGLGPFGPAPVVVEADAAQAEALAADPMLVVTPLDATQGAAPAGPSPRRRGR